MEYRERITDDLLKKKLNVFGAVLITGPKGCGKTTSAKMFARSLVEFQDEDRREQYLSVAGTAPSKLLEGDKPRLFDEWQDAPKIWGVLRKDCDDHPEATGEYYLTGSSSKKIGTPHTGTGRISEICMYPMTLFETGESNGEISLTALFDDENYDKQLNGYRSYIESISNKKVNCYLYSIIDEDYREVKNEY
jgi:predicted AAA+ superfamily ATPase